LLELWVQGVSVQWERLYGEDMPRRISLPTYPFAKERYWIDVRPISASTYQAAPVQEPADVMHISAQPPAKPRIVLQPTSSVGKQSWESDVRDLREYPCEKTHATGDQHTRAEVPIARETPQSLEERLTSSLAAMLLINPKEIDPDAQFKDIGLDSVTGVEWIRSISKEYCVSLPATRLYDHPSIRAFSRFLALQLTVPATTLSAIKATEPARESLEDILEGVYHGEISAARAASLL